uniref:Tc1-like transposase DDE domain-containing protein n=1 Tax=Oncorhynchus tshawytscha TaxID=74940 RepID=A0AAZ3QLC0_ONCTS
MEEEVLWCGGALLVTMSVIYLEFKAHLTSMATTAFCSEMSSHLLLAYLDYHLFFNRTMTQHTSRLCKGYFTKKESDGVLQQMTWPPQSPDLNQIKMVCDELDSRVKEKQPISAQHMWELLQDCWKSISGEAG